MAIIEKYRVIEQTTSAYDLLDLLQDTECAVSLEKQDEADVEDMAKSAAAQSFVVNKFKEELSVTKSEVLSGWGWRRMQSWKEGQESTVWRPQVSERGSIYVRDNTG